MFCEEDLRKLIQNGSPNLNIAIYERYCSEVYGSFASFCKDEIIAKELMNKVFEQAKTDIENGVIIKGKLLIWLINISRKISRTHLLDYSVKKGTERCIRQLVLAEGFSTKEASVILGITPLEAVKKFREALRG